MSRNMQYYISLKFMTTRGS